MKTVFTHLKRYIIRGLLTLIPVMLTYIVLAFLYTNVDRRITEQVVKILGFSIPGLGIVILLGLLYIFGIMASNFIGKRIISLVDMVTTHIPVIKIFYKIGKQLAGAFTLPDFSSFQRTVLIEYLSPGQWTLGFVTGVMENTDGGEPLFRVYVPTPPIPTSGVIIFVKESQTRNPGMSVEEALKVIMSCGLVGPERIALHPVAERK